MNPIRFLDIAGCEALERGFLVTVNVQHLYVAQHDTAFRDLAFSHPAAAHCIDGLGAKLLFDRLADGELPRVAGNELLARKLRGAAGRRVLVIGSDKGSVDAVRPMVPETELVHDDRLLPHLDSVTAKDAAASFAHHGGDFAFIALALGVPKQEYLAAALAERYPHLPILCIGGSFEILSGRYPRAPGWLQRLGLEAFWRMALQPTRARFARTLHTLRWFLYFSAEPARLRRLAGQPA